MSDLERELREILRRQQPSPGLHRRILERVEASERSRRWRREWTLAAIAVGIMIGASSLYWQGQRRHAERAHRELIQALQITARELTLAEGIAAKNLARQEDKQ